MSGGEVAGLIVAVFWAILVCFLAYVLIKLGQVLQETTRLVSNITERTVPLLSEVTTTVTTTNAQLERVDAITARVQDITGNVSSLTAIFTATLGGPLVRTAAFTYGVRRALARRKRHDVEKRVRAQIRAEKHARKA
ncbi:DUF948 domain-containing protein [Carbonactinospora thermoautotrophica]|uniref:Secreted protein n=1 Tax=Carbonactinospora thermoautotrophica TaxID=1469144 RepID=A0A132NAU6_9ACTN|nr:hypothetical protein TH66_03690 [Carbonactinospora thermoautotrophica]KWX07077.1 hypothetical protein TR74_19965 [Carbonactinospora thermoautotrophica]MCX9193044.1 DUF948 domain-containing protein [Carbonactinospora thermoautotrophica]